MLVPGARRGSPGRRRRRATAALAATRVREPGDAAGVRPRRPGLPTPPSTPARYTSTQLAVDLRARPAVRPGAHRDRADDRRRRVRAVRGERLRRLRVLLRPLHADPQRAGRRRPARPARRQPARPRSTSRSPSYNAPSSSLLVYEAPNDNDAASLDLFNRIASDDAARVVTTSWGNCEQFIQASDPSYITEENQIFSRMALQGQTMVAASGDAGSEDCFPNDGSEPGAGRRRSRLAAERGQRRRHQR